MQENVILMTAAAQVTTGRGGRRMPGSLCLPPRVWMFDYQSFCVHVALYMYQVFLRFKDRK
ncbi:hypothetical protein E2C01_058727 [Portunus trituberculatus]|uniref:Uncharacterized protein n=1 Tax=Portunus trituberculatus TaxID=210409 RepID=A0A5B7H3U3_PORTR|nr:hypothetical protein [Portunus trituberculatus]